ncbi:unnamed protein product [Allacma fusca]|uniref:Protein kinase domain-containing protein n=1 Tax=Allacma fusca TaxID=39272 RepID=A0A8J2PWW7_9HEXA|nr:unnamed protein product [Allacma fusca]
MLICATSQSPNFLRSQDISSASFLTQSILSIGKVTRAFTNTTAKRNETKNGTSSRNNPSDSTRNSKWIIISVSFGATALLAFIILILVFRYYSAKKRLQRLMEKEIREFRTGKVRASVVRNSVTGAISVQLFPFRNEITVEDIEMELGKLMEQDNFMSIFPGTIKGRRAILKTTGLKTEFPFFKEFLKDIKVMSYVCHRMHPNIVEFLGALTSNIHNRVIVAGFESSPLGNLKDFLRNNSTSNGTLRSITEDGKIEHIPIPNEKNQNKEAARTLLNWCEQITTAMVFLHQENLVHGDLSASNILLFPNNCIKVSDLCSWRKEFERNYYIENFRAPPKWRWMAIEDPHPGILWSPKFVSALENGYRMDVPTFSTQTLYQMLLRCWYRYPNDRLNFIQIKEIIKDCMQAPSLSAN